MGYITSTYTRVDLSRRDMTQASHCFSVSSDEDDVCYPVDEDTEGDGKEADHSAL
jgi:hypothetical protein